MKYKKKVGIVGYGYVGTAMGRFFQKNYDVVVYDPMAGSPTTQDQLNECVAALVCVPTPMAKDGSCDTSIVRSVISWLKTPLIIIKSTVTPGFTDQVRSEFNKAVVFSPEYCGESSYWTPYAFHEDVKETPFFIFGGDPKDTATAVDLYVPVVGPTKTFRQTTATAAELAKYMENSFFAAKIMFCYEMANICEQTGVDYNVVRDLWLLDPRINPMHTAVFADNKQPFGGKCLPKDLNALIAASVAKGYDPIFLKEVLNSNERIGIIRSQHNS